MRKVREDRILLLFLIVVFIISIFLLILLGESETGILLAILHALLFLPIEVYATVFFLGNLLDKREDRLEEARQDSYYFSIANQSQEQLLLTIKKGLIENFLVERSNRIEEDFERLYQEREQLLTNAFWQDCLISQYDLVDDHIIPNEKVFPLTLSTKIGKYITRDITDFYAIYLKFIPLDIFQSLHGIYQILEISLLFSDNPYLMEQRYSLITKYEKHQLVDRDFIELARISQQIVAEVYEKIQTIETITNEHYKNLTTEKA